jgi:hypothetical protein
VSAEFKPKATRWHLGFDGGYITPARSRWAGNVYWLVANRDAVPARVRKAMSPGTLSAAQLARKVAPLLAPWEQGHSIAIESFGDPVPWSSEIYVRAIHPAGILNESCLRLAVNAHFLAWVEKHLPKPGEWHLTLRGQIINAHGKNVQAIVQPVVMRGASIVRVYGYEDVPGKGAMV